MASLIVIRIIPPTPIDSGAFAGYLNPPGLGPLQISAYDLSFNDPTGGQLIGTATYVPPTAAPGAPTQFNPLTDPVPPPSSPANYGSTTIAQDVKLVPPEPTSNPLLWNSEYYAFQSVATAVIPVATVPAFENLRLVASWGSGANAPTIPVANTFYDVTLLNGTLDPATWQALSPPSLYLELPAPPSSGAQVSVQLPGDGSAPRFDTLLNAVMQVLGSDPGGGFTKAQLGGMTPQQCLNTAYEILWSQQPPLPAPPSSDAIDDLYTYPTNSGNLIDGTTPNQHESDRRQFEAKLQSYYALTDATAGRLANCIFSLGAAVACEQQSLAATEALLTFPAQSPGTPLNQATVTFTGIKGLSPALNFGVPAAYFYALAGAMPTNITAQQRFAMATGDQLQNLLDNLTAAIVTQTITDNEAFVTATGGAINAAQAARRIVALAASSGSSIPLAPLGTFSLLTSAEDPQGQILTFASTAAVSGGLATNDGVTVTGGLTANGADLAVNSLVQSAPSSTTVQINQTTLSSTPMPMGAAIVFSPVNPPQMQALIQSWLAFPPTPAMPGPTSSQAYQPSDDATKFWPTAVTAQPHAVLNLVLSALTQGFIIPPPFNTALGSEIVKWLAEPPLSLPQTVAGLTAVTTQQWTALFRKNPTWLPGQQGDATARIAAFLQTLNKFFAIASSGPKSSLNLATSGNTPNGAVLPFASTAGVEIGMSVSSADNNIPAGTTVIAPPTPNSVTISANIAGTIPFGTNIVFTPNIQSVSNSGLPLLQRPSKEWLGACLTAYNPAYKFGDGIANPGQLATAAGTVFQNDDKAQRWLVDAITAIDALYQIVNKMMPAPASDGAKFSLVEALYARGFTSAANVTELSAADFQQALIGTVAYDANSGGAIYAAAATFSPPAAAPAAPGPFQPVNSGSLTNCIPPPSRSPLGPIAYLNEMLQVSEASTCDKPLTPGAANTLGAVLTTRRGPLGQLSASAANLETPLPLIDIVNENLEFMASNLGQAHGTVFDTGAATLAGFALCQEEHCPEEEHAKDCHDPETIFGALPEHSTPVTRTAASGAIDPSVYDTLKSDFSSCKLPYSQPLDVNRTYVGHFGSCRFEEMRSFRKCITEFVLAPDKEPIDFQKHLWRYPVRIDIAIEYLGLSPEEYALIFQGTPSLPCAARGDDRQDGLAAALLRAPQFYGFPATDEQWSKVVVQLPEFLARTCLSYCEFVEMWKSGYVQFYKRDDEKKEGFPECEPCCLDKLVLQFPNTQEQPLEVSLYKLAVFIRLWRKLKEQCCRGYTFERLRDICDVLHLFNGAAINHDFIRQLAAFEMLCDHFGMALTDPDDKPPATAIDADRTQILSLWVDPNATQAPWGIKPWAIKQLIDCVEKHAMHRHGCERRAPEFVKLLLANLDPLSQLAGFDPASPAGNWHALPTHTLRFAEILAKIYASDFSVGEILYLFTVQDHLDGDDPFALQTQDDALDLPLALPDDLHEHSLWRLRAKLLEAAEADDDEALGWKRIEAELQSIFDFTAAEVRSLGTHFFPGVLEHAGNQVAAGETRFVSNLVNTNTRPQTWNIPPDGPFHYDSGGQQLWTRLPLRDEAVLAKLKHAYSLGQEERAAVQDLCFQPRAQLARFGLLFSDFAAAERHMIETREESERWDYFQRQFALCRRRCRIVAEHLTGHVAAATGRKHPEGAAPAMLILRELLADENELAGSSPPSWENDNGNHGPVTWTPPNGGAFAGLLALTGTGLVAEYKLEGGPIVWRDICGSLSAFGAERDRENCPVPTVLPAMDAQITPAQMQLVSVQNGFLMKDSTGAWLGGAQGFAVNWSGALLVDGEGAYEFSAGAPAGGDDEPNIEAVEHQHWRVTLKRGQRTWILLAHRWPGEEERHISSLSLKRGAYDLIIELRRPTPEFHDDEKIRPQHTGFQLKYAGPDSGGRRVAVPHDRLFCVFKERPFGDGVATLGANAGAASYLGQLYVGSFRDMRRTYQRAFKALLFAHRFKLSAHRRADGVSELGYMLAQKSNFAGVAYYNPGVGYKEHLADFDFNYLPLLDDYHAQTQAQDARTGPLPQRMQAMFDWWERIFDYAVVRKDVRQRSDRHLWHLFDEAFEKQPVPPGNLLRHMGADSRRWALDLSFFQGQHSNVYQVTSVDLEDDRWVTRVWRADHWLRAMQHLFAVKDITKARPDLWTSDDPGALVFGETETGNANLIAFVCQSAFDNGEPRRYEEVRRLDDALRERARDALVVYLCNGNRVKLPWPGTTYAATLRDLSDLLLLDIGSGLHQKASRIDEAITAAQSFIRRARLDLEPQWKITGEFARMWDREFSSFHVWQACKRRHLYKENWIEWDEFEKARRIEAFDFLDSKLRSAELTAAVPGGLEWWPDETVPIHKSLELLQKREASQIKVLPAPREGLDLLGTPEHDARPSWLSPVGPPAPNPGFVTAEPLPLWMQAAIRLGTRFVRVAAAGVPPAAMGFEPHKHHDKGCVTCCEECGCEHPAHVDEYYFWLIEGAYYDNPQLPQGFPPVEPDDGYQYGFQDDFYDSVQQQAAYWEDPTQLPQLLDWPTQPMVRLAWCRLHNGKFQQPRRSLKGVAVQPGAVDLKFVQRIGDSLYFEVTGGTAPAGYADPAKPGFRYDLAPDFAVTLPLVAKPQPNPNFVNSLLPAYPYFAYVVPGDRLFPLAAYAPAVAVAQALRSHCRFEAALKWYRRAFDPVASDCTWIDCGNAAQTQDGTQSPPAAANTGVDTLSTGNTTVSLPGNAAPAAAIPPAPPPSAPSACCDATNVSCAQAKDRSIVLLYLETLREWGDAVMRRRNCPEGFQQARVIFNAAQRILGKRPDSIVLPEPATAQSVAAFKPEFAPLNARLLDLYDTVHDRLGLIHQSLNSKRLQNGIARREMPYFGDSSLRQGWHTTTQPCVEETEWCLLPSPYRFSFLIQKAQDLAAKVQELGSALLAAFEKGDAEYLACLRAQYESELLTLGLDAKKDQWREADWQVESLQKTKAVSQTNLSYYNTLIQNGLISGEIGYQTLTGVSTGLRAAGNIIEISGEAANGVGNYFDGIAGFGGTPLVYQQLPIGQPLGAVFAGAARVMNALADIASSTAGLMLTQAGWQRRHDEWVHETQILAIEIQQIERQILGAHRRRDQMLLELNSHRRQMEHAREAQNFLRDKFTSVDLYLYLQRESAALYYQTYDLALHVARQAEHAYNLERGYTARRFVPEHAWDDMREGLLAGEKLSLALRHMEKCYLDENVREYELTKHVSLRLHFPAEFLRLRTTGICEIDIPEWMFDLDFPGQYMRRIKNVTLTIPCVSGPYSGVHCRLTLISSVTRIAPLLTAPLHSCCCPPKACCCGDEKSSEGYALCADDPRMVKVYGDREAIATSGGQNDSGMFELNFNDARYLPFEYMGAISRWRIELPPENNYFDLNSLTDTILHLNYTAREGGEELRRAAREAACKKVPGDGWTFFDVRHEFPDAWELFRRSCTESERTRELQVRLRRNLFPFLPRDPDIALSKIMLIFETEEMLDHACPEPGPCPCPQRELCASHKVELSVCAKGDEREEEASSFNCYSAEQWRGFYTGIVDSKTEPLRREHESCEMRFSFPKEAGEIVRVYLFCHYELIDECCSPRPKPMQRHSAHKTDHVDRKLEPLRSNGSRPH
jgi:hypothetical protein